MVARNEEFAGGEYTIAQGRVFSCAAVVKWVAAILQDFQMRAIREQAEAKTQRDRKRRMQDDLRRQTIKGLPLEDLINMGFRHFS